MKRSCFIFILLVAVVALTSCLIREPEDKSDLTKGGMQMFREAEGSIIHQTKIFDIMMCIDGYVRTPDSLKSFYLRNNNKYGIRINQNKYSFKLSSDSLCVDFARTKSMFNVGEEFFILNKVSQYDTLRVNCIEKNKWQLKTANFNFTQWFVKQQQLKVSCADTVTPAHYKKAYFYVTGNARLFLTDYIQDVVLDYNITEPLKFGIDSVSFKVGVIETTAADSISTSNLHQTSFGRYLNTKPLSVEITIRGISYIYKNWGGGYYYNY